jgi:hypothetical protein
VDHFEAIMKTLLEAENCWVCQSFKVNLTKKEKVKIGKAKMPRPELDLLALNFNKNEIYVIEAKSFLDSPGVRIADLTGRHHHPEGRYKLFTSSHYRNIVFSRLRVDLRKRGMANNATKLILTLAAGKVARGNGESVHKFLKSKKFDFWSPERIKEKVTKLADRKFENDSAIITAKILLR